MSTHFTIKKLKLAAAVSIALGSTSFMAQAQQNDKESADETEVIKITGIRSALASALNEKRAADSLVEVIKAEDIGKLPDNNLAEVLENITGVQIDRTAGVGTGVQIRGTGANRVEINGVSTVTAGSGRTGISFDDLPAALIASLEVIKVPEAKTVEGSVGGTINLRTLRGNSLDERLVQFKVQAENSDLADATSPRLSATLGDNWQTDFGKLGVVVTGSYAEQEVASADPRFDRDRVVAPDSGRGSAESFPFLRTQFLDQPLNAASYETTNFTASIELQKTEDLSFYLDATLNDQSRQRNLSRAFFSGTGANGVVDNTTNTGFTTIDLGSVDGRFGQLDLGEVQVVTSGILGVGGSDPNLRTQNNNSTRLTKSSVFAFGTEYLAENYTLKAEISHSASDTDTPSLNSALDFINPNSTAPSPTTSADNGVPAIFAINNNTFEFGIAPNLAETPTVEQLLDPANYALRDVGQGLGQREGSETAFRVDVNYDVSDRGLFFSDVDAGLRWNTTTNKNQSESVSNRFRNWNRPRADLFSEIIVPGASNFGDIDSRSLFISDYLIIDNDISRNNPGYVIDVINQAILANNQALGEDVNSTLAAPSSSTTSFFDIEETTLALYLQGNFEREIGDVYIRGNAGIRYVTTEQEAIGNSVVGDEVTRNSAQSDYDYVLPRFNLVAELTDDFVVRAGIGKDLRRPNFNSLSTSANFPTSVTGRVTIGNPNLEPETVWSYDLSAEYYFSPSSFVSVGLFHKERDNLITTITSEPAEPIGASGQVEREQDPTCPGGGIFNPNVPAENFNVFSTSTTDGICVVSSRPINADGTETQSGIEIAGQFDLSEYEDTLGWASGFGVIANYTYQESGEGLTDFRTATSAINQILGRTDTDNSTATLADDVVTQRITLDDLSENSYNFTLFYDKHDLNVRLRYTYRDAFTETLNRMRFSLPPVVGARGQLNMSIGYELNDMVTIGVEGVNLTREDRTRWCFNENTLLCEQSLSDRRMTVGISVKL